MPFDRKPPAPAALSLNLYHSNMIEPIPSTTPTGISSSRVVALCLTFLLLAADITRAQTTTYDYTLVPCTEGILMDRMTAVGDTLYTSTLVEGIKVYEDKSTGQIVCTPMTSIGAMTAVGGTLYAASGDGVYRYNAANGSWSVVSDNYFGTFILQLEIAESTWVVSTPQNDIIYSRNAGGDWETVSLSSLGINWIRDITIAGSTLLAATDQGVAVVDLDEGTVTMPIEGFDAAAVVVTPQHIVVGEMSGGVRIYTRSFDSPLSVKEIDILFGLFSLEPGDPGSLLIGAANGSVHRLDLTTLKLVERWNSETPFIVYRVARTPDLIFLGTDDGLWWRRSGASSVEAAEDVESRIDLK